MDSWNVYEQKNGHLRRVGRVGGHNGKEAIEQARKDFHLRWPVVHKLNEAGQEIYG